MKTNKVIVILSIALIFACQPHDDSNNGVNEVPKETKSTDINLNISILLDLSDRLEREVQPSQMKRDLNIIKKITQVFRKDMQEKGAFQANGKLRVLFKPTPDDPDINKLASKLNVDLSEMQNTQKKDVYDNIQNNFENALTQIYSLTLETRNWIGSDIWRFFKNDVQDLCIEKDDSYRNILVIVTDGYIYHKQSVERSNNKTSYVTPAYLRNEGFRDTNSWEKKLSSEDYGLISFDKDLSDLEVMVLEVNSSEVHKAEEDVIKAFLGNWLSEMNVNHYEIHNTDLPTNTSVRIENFLEK